MSKDGQRQFVKYKFYKVDPQWRRLPAQQRDEGKAQFAAVVEEFASQMAIRSYSLTGLRGDCGAPLYPAGNAYLHLRPQAPARGAGQLGVISRIVKREN